jgi:hypothetical protein
MDAMSALADASGWRRSHPDFSISDVPEVGEVGGGPIHCGQQLVHLDGAPVTANLLPGIMGHYPV